MLSYSDVEKLEMTAKASNAKEPAYNGLKKKKNPTIPIPWNQEHSIKTNATTKNL